MAAMDKTERFSKADLNERQVYEGKNPYAPYAPSNVYMRKKGTLERSLDRLARKGKEIRAPRFSSLAKLLYIPAILFRLLAWVYVALAVVNAFVLPQSRLLVLGITNSFAHVMPTQVQGILVFESFFGGSVRGDFCLAAVLLLVLDYVCCRLAHAK